MNLNMAEVLSLIAILVSFCGLFWTIFYNRKQLRLNLFGSAHASFISVEQQLSNCGSALRFHGISLEQLEEHGLTSQEFAYLLTNFTAGGIYYKSIDDKSPVTPFPKDEYYYSMLLSPYTQKAWPLLRNCIGPSLFRDKIEATLQVIRENIN